MSRNGGFQVIVYLDTITDECDFRRMLEGKGIDTINATNPRNELSKNHVAIDNKLVDLQWLIQVAEDCCAMGVDVTFWDAPDF